MAVYAAGEQNERPTLAKLPMAELLAVISEAKMPSSARIECVKDGKRPQSVGEKRAEALKLEFLGKERVVSRERRVSSCSTREGSASRPSSASRPNSARSSRPSSAPRSRPNSARPLSARCSTPDSPRPFFVAVPQGKRFGGNSGFLEAKEAGNGSQWDKERMLQPERAYPCVANNMAAEYHDRHPERVGRAPWKPTKANRVCGMGVQVAPAFPLPPRPSSAAKTPRDYQRH